MESELVIVIPTYNAKEGIIENINKILSKIPLSKIIIVDDNSPDKTAAIIDENFRNDKRIKVLNRKAKGGRGSAVIAGFKEGLKNKNAKYFIEMDADLCHNPKYISSMIKKCKNADVVIVSRYLPSSHIYGWNLKRKLMSLLINVFAKIVLNIPISDYTNGFRCYSKKAVDLICRGDVKSRGYIVLSEIAYLCYQEKLKFAEVPIDFYFKEITRSNLNLKEVKEALFTIVRLRFNNNEKK
ncbi:MAG TPA: glycosyltransferase [Patescibacteria group bacterium]